ncbi:MAG: SPASM domain-containing protein [Paludibacteraceae bacterium]|nr:SPASM domain-containing protein [Paludibacteraceae bacterium]
MSIKSLANHILAECCYVLSRLGIACAPPMPDFLSVEPANICQLACPQCPVGLANANRHDSDTLPTVDRRSNLPLSNPVLDLQHFRHILSQTQGFVHTVQFFFQGEPLLNKDLPEMIRLAHQEHIYTITSTNAQALTPLLAEQLIQAQLDKIIVSIDGLSEESYASYRQGGSLNQALRGLVCLRNAKNQFGGHTQIELQCLMLKSNEHEWDMFRRSYRQMGADSLSLKTAQFYDYVHGNPLMPSDERYSRYALQTDGTYRPKNRLHSQVHKPCRRLFHGCVISVNGDVFPCCFDKTGQYKMGNIYSQSLRSIWHGEAFQRFRKQVYVNRMKFPICTNCTEK